jgi:peptide/nickel transport system permease protein
MPERPDTMPPDVLPTAAPVEGELALATTEAALSAPVEMAATKRLGLFGYLAAAWLSLVVFVAVFVPWLPFEDPDKVFAELKVRGKVQGPGVAGHLLGGDRGANDLLARIAWGTRSSILLAVCAVLIGLLVGGALGLIAGFYRGRTDTLLSGLFDTFLALPQLVLSLAVISVFANQDNVSDTRRMFFLILTLGIVSVPILARITRANTLAWSQREFVLAARTLGAKNPRIIIREVLPNVLPAMFSISLLGVAVVIVAEGGLSILGVGVKLPTPSWGNIIAVNRDILSSAPWTVFAPSIVIFLTVLSLNYLGDVVRARFDVRESGL